MAKKIKEQGMIADIPLRSTTKVYYVRMENGMPSGDEGWVTVDEAKRMNATDRRTHGQPMNRYFQDQQSAQDFVANPPAGEQPSEMPPAEEPMAPVGDEMGGEPGMGEPDLGGMPGGDEMGMEPPIGEEPVDDFGAGLEDASLGEPDLGDDMGMGDEEDALGDLGGDELGLEPEEEQDFELVVPRRVRLVPAKESLGEADMRGFASKTGLTPDEVDKKQLRMGIKVEMEHTADKDVATRIALDHLAEIPDYYTRLAELEDEAKSDGKFTEVESFEALVDDVVEKRFKIGKRAKKAAGKSYSKKKNPDAYYGTATNIQKAINAKESEEGEPEQQVEAEKCKYCGGGVQNGLCMQCRRLQGEQPKADFRDEPHNGVRKHMRRRGESMESTEAGIIEALINGDCTVAEAIESLEEVGVGNPYGATYNKRDQGILGRQVGAYTQNIKAPQIDWNKQQQQQQQGAQLPPDIQPMYDQYMQAVQSGDTMTANKLKQNLVWELQIQGIDPATVGIR